MIIEIIFVKLKTMINKIIPKVHNLPQVIYVRWMDKDWFIKKN